jgi:hypothetical protein
MKTITLQLDEHDAGAILDAVNDAAIALRTNLMSGVVMAEEKFLESGISEGRKNHYLLLKDYVNILAELVRLA